MARIITLTTDFGLEDEFVGVMKGVILSRAPAATIVDLSHAIARQNVRQAALLIMSAYRFFPAGTIHLVVVDPGVGSNRKLILLQAGKHFFLAPDNGVLGLLLEPEYFQAAYEVQCSQYYLQPLSATFHGRDILAPVAACLASGLDSAAVGEVIEREHLKKLKIPAAKIDQDQSLITGEVIGRDHFGNLLTNIDADLLEDLSGKEKASVKITLMGETFFGIERAFNRKKPGELLAIVGSREKLEIAVNRGSAADLLDGATGAAVKISLPKR